MWNRKNRNFQETETGVGSFFFCFLQSSKLFVAKEIDVHLLRWNRFVEDYQSKLKKILCNVVDETGDIPNLLCANELGVALTNHE